LTLLLGPAITDAPGAPNGVVTLLSDGGAMPLSDGDGVTALEDVAGGDEIKAGETFVALAGISADAFCCGTASILPGAMFADAETVPPTTAAFGSASALSVVPGVVGGAVGVAAPTIDEPAGIDIVATGVAAVVAAVAAGIVNGGGTGVTGGDAAAEVGANGVTTGGAAVAGDCARASWVSAAAASTAAIASVSALREKKTRFFSTDKA
jgi:hypothetical protein